jgi:hypothetical protein
VVEGGVGGSCDADGDRIDVVDAPTTVVVAFLELVSVAIVAAVMVDILAAAVVTTLATVAVVPLRSAMVVRSAIAVVGVSACEVVPGDVALPTPATNVVGEASPAVVVTTLVLVTFMGVGLDLGGGQAG